MFEVLASHSEARVVVLIHLWAVALMEPSAEHVEVVPACLPGVFEVVSGMGESGVRVSEAAEYVGHVADRRLRWFRQAV